MLNNFFIDTLTKTPKDTRKIAPKFRRQDIDLKYCTFYMDAFDMLKSDKSTEFIMDIGTWQGMGAGGKVGNDFENDFYDFVKDCVYIKIWDENGHLYIKAAHHDGTNFAEIKLLNDRGIQIYENWEYDYNNKKTEQEIHEMLYSTNFYSSLPHFAREM